MSFLSRAAGGGVGATKVWSRLPELLFAVPFGLAAYLGTGCWLIGILGAIASYYAMEMGHGTVYEMNGYFDHNRDNPDKPRVQTLEKIVRPIYVGLFKGDIYKPLYSWLCMGLKGLLIGLAAFPFGLSLAFLWPLSYWISRKVIKDKASAEWISGAFAGLTAALAILV